MGVADELEETAAQLRKMAREKIEAAVRFRGMRASFELSVAANHLYRLAGKMSKSAERIRGGK